MAVNSPTDKQAKDKDIARKLKLYGVRPLSLPSFLPFSSLPSHSFLALRPLKLCRLAPSLTTLN
jgi:hypothetical protein